MHSPEGYNLELPENINARNEAHDINDMVDENLITGQEAGEFAYENEMEIPEALLSAAPKVTERMRQHIIGKFPPESFEPENIAGTLVHGSFVHALKPLFFGQGKIVSEWDGYKMTGTSQIIAAPEKGTVEFRGFTSSLDQRGFQPNKHGEVGFSDHYMFYFILGNQNTIDDNFFQSRPDYDKNAARDETIFDAYGDFLQPQALCVIYNEKIRLQATDYEECTELPTDAYKYPESRYFPDIVKSSKGNFSSDIKEYIKDLPVSEYINRINDYRSKLRRKAEKYGEENLYNFDGGINIPSRGFPNYLTINQFVNYAARIMCEGIDKSKIDPIYDQNGKILWPTEEDVIEEETSASEIE